MQHALQSVGQTPATPSIVPGNAYVYDIEHRSGQVDATIHAYDISAILVAGTLGCPGGNSAAVASVTGGVVIGMDFYGQFVSETVAADGTSDYTFSRVIVAPADALWTNTYGLPYKYLSGGDDVGTYVASATAGDPRGTFTPATIADGEFKLNYIADRTALYGQPMSERFTSGDIVTGAAAAGTISATGAISITTVEVAGAGAELTFFFPNGHTITVANAAATAAVVYQLPRLWVSQYMKQLDTAAIDRLVTYQGTNTNVTGKADLTLT
jgi:hypothetical protein